MNCKGFTLVELLAVIVILAIISSIGGYAVGSYINNAKEKADKLLISNINTAAQLYIDECSSGISSLCSITPIVNGNDKQYIMNNISLDTLASYNYLTATNNQVLDSSQNDIGNCKISIVKNVSSDYIVTYEVKSLTTNVDGITCPIESGGLYQ